MPTLHGPDLEQSPPEADERVVEWRSVGVVLLQQLLLRLLVLLVVDGAGLVSLLEIRQFLSQGGRFRLYRLLAAAAAAEAAVLFCHEKPLLNN